MKLLRLLLVLGILASSPALAFNAVVGGEGVEPADPIAKASVLLSSAHGNCSGTLIAPRWVLTAAHCIQPANGNNVTFYLVSFPGLGLDTDLEADEFIVHEAWSSSEHVNDIALIHLPEVAPSSARPARLASSNPGQGASAWIAGFGRGHSVNSLHKFSTRLTDNEDSSLLRWHQTGETGICFGDSGGGVFVNGELAGVNSHFLEPNDHDCTRELDVTATSVAAYRGWIRNKTSGKDLAL